jgi:hypothetical protein
MPVNTESKNLGNGNFNVAFSDYCAYGSCPEGGSNMCITATSTGTYRDGTRVLASRYCREFGEGCTPNLRLPSVVSCP